MPGPEQNKCILCGTAADIYHKNDRIDCTCSGCGKLSVDETYQGRFRGFPENKIKVACVLAEMELYQFN